MIPRSQLIVVEAGDSLGISESRYEERLLRVKRSVKEHIFALTGETPQGSAADRGGSPHAPGKRPAGTQINVFKIIPDTSAIAIGKFRF